MEKTTNMTAKIAINKSVLASYEVNGVKTSYLKDGTEFQIELFNPFQSKILCKISLDGTSIGGGGLILNPGQRYFLERYLDDNRKFKFSTYEVDSDEVVENAIKKNGDIQIDFYSVYIPYTYDMSYGINFIDQPINIYNCESMPLTHNVMYQSSGSYNNSKLTISTANTFGNKKETGIITKGSKSKDRFQNSYENFNFTPFQTEKLKLLPVSEKVFETNEIKHKKYCSNCGKKVNQSDKFCSSCGNKL